MVTSRVSCRERTALYHRSALAVRSSATRNAVFSRLWHKAERSEQIDVVKVTDRSASPQQLENAQESGRDAAIALSFQGLGTKAERSERIDVVKVTDRSASPQQLENAQESGRDAATALSFQGLGTKAERSEVVKVTDRSASRQRLENAEESHRKLTDRAASRQPLENAEESHRGSVWQGCMTRVGTFSVDSFAGQR
jgi:hypothetical protein